MFWLLQAEDQLVAGVDETKVKVVVALEDYYIIHLNLYQHRTTQ
jgi:hypothetical protein